MTRTQARNFLSDWQFWTGVAYIGLALVVVGLYFVNGRTNRAATKVAKESAIHQAEISAAKRQHANDLRVKVETCLNSRPQLARINAFIFAVKTTHDVLEQNARATLDVTAPHDPAYETRLRNYERIRGTEASFAGVHFDVPTKKACRARGAS